MKTTPLIRCALAALLVSAFPNIRARAHDVAAEMADTAKNFLAALTPEQQAKAVYDFKDDERYDWHFIPKPRKGLPVKEMTSEQRVLAYALVSTGLSHRGYFKATTIMSLEQILHDMEAKNPKAERNPELYFITIFGKPGPTGTWGWRVEGHHVSQNFAVADGKIVGETPSFFGTNPAEVREGPRAGLRVLAVEQDLGRQLVKSLDDEQKKTAIISAEAPKDVTTTNLRKVNRETPAGVAYSKMNAEQKAVLVRLIKEFLGNHRPELADADWAAIEKDGLDNVHFAWAGAVEPGQGHYYRVQGQRFLLEFDNTQNDANHIHTVWRDYDNDWGEDLLKKHYEQTPHAAK
jgi:uncharacterized protein DUF3500